MASMEEDLDAFVEKKSFRRMAKEAETPSPVRRVMNDPSRAGKTAAEIEMEKFMKPRLSWTATARMECLSF